MTGAGRAGRAGVEEARAKLERSRLDSIWYAADLDALVILAQAREKLGWHANNRGGKVTRAMLYLMDRNGLKMLTGCREFQERWRAAGTETKEEEG